MNPLTISALNTHIVALFERDELLRDLWVVGEVSNWKTRHQWSYLFQLKRQRRYYQRCHVEGQCANAYLAAA